MAEKPNATKPAAKTGSKPAASATAEEMAHVEKLLGGGGAQTDASTEAKAHGEKAPAGKKKKGGKAKGPSLSARISEGMKRGRIQLIEIFRGLRSPDGPTRAMSLFFFVSLAGVITLGVLTAERKMRLKQDRIAQAVTAQENAAERNHEAALFGGSEAPGDSARTVSMLNLGQFTIELRPIAGQPKKSGFMNMAEVELVIECDSKDTHDFIEENLIQARSQVTDIILSMDREVLLSREGKRKLKKKLLEKLNGWIPRGKVQNVFFSKLVIA